MPVFSCGGMRYQQSWQDIKEEEIDAEKQANLEATVRRALDVGINHIETARGYGSSEMQLGKILPGLPREKMIVQTKVGPHEDRAEFERNFERSMSLLKLDYVDLVALHGINNARVLETALKQDASLAVLKQAQKDGRIGHIGFSTHGPTDVICRAIESDFFDYVNLHWFFVEQRNIAAIEAAAKRDMGVFIISPSDKGGKLYTPPEKLVSLCAPYTPMAFNDLFCLANPSVHTLSIGAARPTDFDAHLEALPFLNDGLKAVGPVMERLQQQLADVLGLDWANHWDEGIPGWEDVPGQANVYQTLRLYSLWKAFDMLEYGRMRYNLLGNGGHWFPGEKISAIDWDTLGATLADSPFAETIPAFLREAHEAFNQQDEKRLSESE